MIQIVFLRGFTIFLLCFALPVHSLKATDAKKASLGNSGVTLSGLWSTQNNPAGLSNISNPIAGINYSNSFLISSLSTREFASCVPTKFGSIGLSYTVFGYNLYKESRMNVAYAKSFGNKFSAGIAIDYTKVNLGQNDETKHYFIAQIGIQVQLSNNLILGTHIYNPTRTSLAKYDDENVPTLIQVGINYKLSDHVFICAEAEKDIAYPPALKFGLEYQPKKGFYLRTGVSSNPMISCFGFGFKFLRLSFDFSANYHFDLGFSPIASILYEFGMKK